MQKKYVNKVAKMLCYGTIIFISWLLMLTTTGKPDNVPIEQLLLNCTLLSYIYSTYI